MKAWTKYLTFKAKTRTMYSHHRGSIKLGWKTEKVTTSARGPMNDNRTGNSRRPFSAPRATSNAKITKKYLQQTPQTASNHSYSNWGTCIAPPTRRPRGHHRVNPYPGAHRQNETEMFSDPKLKFIQWELYKKYFQPQNFRTVMYN